MLNEKELDELGILDWSILAKQFIGSDLFLGNGFSLNFSDRLHYDSLFDKFLANCSSKDRHIFESFETSNFELILEELSNAKDVNEIFNIDVPQIERATQSLKDGLIKTIQAIHPLWDETNTEKLERIANQLNSFNDIFTLNYDLFLYWIIQILRDKRRKGEDIEPYCDYFYDENYSGQYTRFVDQKLPGYKRYIYYLHGALFLFKESPYDLKLRRAGSFTEFVKLIGEAIKEGRRPLFVSEGKAKEKMVAISRSNYLRFALDELKEATNSLVIFGTSLSVDQHIVNAINHNRNDRRLAVSIYVGKKSSDEIESEIHRIKSKFPRHEVGFFNTGTLFQFDA